MLIVDIITEGGAPVPGMGDLTFESMRLSFLSCSVSVAGWSGQVESKYSTSPACSPTPNCLPFDCEYIHSAFRLSRAVTGLQDNNKYGSVQELRSTFGHLNSFKRLA